MQLHYKILSFNILAFLLCLKTFAQHPDSIAVQPDKLPAYGQTSGIHSFKHHSLIPAIADDPLVQLQGQIPGLLMLKSGGDPRTTFSMRAHGSSSFYGSNQPLIWVDGVPADDLLLLRQEDIDSIAVLQDAASTAMYGAGAASGVILIKTKSGSKPGLSISYQAGASVGQDAKRPKVLDASDFLAAGGLGITPQGSSSTDWHEEVLQSALSNSHHLSIGYRAKRWGLQGSGAFQNREALLKNTHNMQLNSRINTYFHSANGKIKLKGGWAGGTKNAEPGFVEAMRYAVTFNPTATVKNDDAMFTSSGGYVQASFFDYFNPVAILEQNKNFDNRYSWMGHFGADIQINNAFSIGSHTAYRNRMTKNGQYYPEESLFRANTFKEYVQVSNEDNSNLYIDINLKYRKTKGGKSWGFDAAYILNKDVYEFQYREGRDVTPSNSSPRTLNDIFSLNLSDALTNGRSIDRKVDKNNGGFLGAFTYKNRNIHFNGGIRTVSATGSSAMQPKMAVLPFATINIGKPRFGLNASFGQSANQHFDSYIDTAGTAYFGKKTEFALGASSALEKFNFNATAYINNSKDPLSQRVILGLPLYVNIHPNSYAIISNMGLAMDANYKIINTDRISWTAGLNFTIQRSVVQDLKVESDAFWAEGKNILAPTGGPGMGDSYYQQLYKGALIGEFWAPTFDGVDANGITKLKDENQDGFISELDWRKIGSGMPSFWLSLQNQVQIGRFNTAFRVRHVGGHDMVNENAVFYTGVTRNYNAVVTDFSQLNIKTNIYNDRNVEKARYTRLDLLQIGYDFKLSHFDLSLHIGGQNLFTLTPFSGNDPEPHLKDIGPTTNGSTWISPLNNFSPGIERRNNYLPERNYFIQLVAQF